MRLGLSVFIALFMLSSALVAAGWVLTARLTPEALRSTRLRWLAGWSWKGFLIPAALWALLNLGLSWSVQPFMPEIQAAQFGGGPWVPLYLRIAGAGIFVVATYWTAATLAWVLLELGLALKGDDREKLKALCMASSLLAGLLALGVVLFWGWSLAGLAALLILLPIAGYAPSLLRPRKMPPMYSRAIAKMKFGKYTEAEWEIIRQLESSDDDFNGWMMLAELYADHFNDLAGAEETILEICDQPKATPTQISVALHRLADWHLKMGGSPDAAQRALQMIIDRLPGTHLAYMALLRIRQLPRSVDELQEMRAPQPVPLPALGDSLDQPAPVTEVDRGRALEEANGLVKRLQKEPNHVPTREKLARLLAEQLGDVERAIEQCALLLELPEQPELKRAEWLSHIAAWQLRYRQDKQGARETLERLIREFSGTPQAFAARRRLQLLERGG